MCEDDKKFILDDMYEIRLLEKMVFFALESGFAQFFDLDEYQIECCSNIENKLTECQYV